MGKHFFDYEDGDFAYSISDNMAIDSDGSGELDDDEIYIISDGDMTMDSGELHIISGWPNEDDDN